MGEPLIFNVGEIRKDTNEDKEFRLAARYWDARIKFSIGPDQYFMTIKDGKISEFTAGTQGFDPYEIDIGGPEEVWTEMLKEVPPAYYQSFLPAQVFFGMSLGGDLAAIYSHYAALERILVIMRRCNIALAA